jgi:hypothetical protein
MSHRPLIVKLNIYYNNGRLVVSMAGHTFGMLCTVDYKDRLKSKSCLSGV